MRERARPQKNPQQCSYIARSFPRTKTALAPKRTRIDRVGDCTDKEATVSLQRALIEIDRAIGDGRVLRDPEVLASYAHDESEAAPRMPDAVVRVRSAAETVAVMRAAASHRVPVTARAGGTGRTGGSIPLAGGIVVAFEQQNRIKGIEPEELITVC